MVIVRFLTSEFVERFAVTECDEGDFDGEHLDLSRAVSGNDIRFMVFI